MKYLALLLLTVLPLITSHAHAQALLPQSVEAARMAGTQPFVIDTSGYTPKKAGQKGAFRISPQESRVIRLPAEAASAVNSNPGVLSVALDTPQTLILSPLTQGVSHVTVLGKESETLLQETVIVTPHGGDVLSIHNACTGAMDETSCEAQIDYYCPNGCYEITEVVPSGVTP